MRKRNMTPNRVISNLDDEINTSEYPYYRYIPVNNIREKQEKMINRLQQLSNKDDTEEEIIIPKRPMSPVSKGPLMYEGPPVSQLPVFTLVATNEKNTYKVDMSPLEDLKKLEAQLEDLQNQIAHASETINGQQNAISANEQALQEQVSRINTGNQVIQHNGYCINQQLATFHHNSQLIQNQTHYINAYNADIIHQQQTIESLNTEITNLQEQLENVQINLEGSTNQLAYHGSMLSAFNTLIQNPQYFQQLMSATSAFIPEQTINEY